jgi:hypothetical protein
VAKALLDHPNAMGAFAFSDKIFDPTVKISKFRETKYKGLG